MKDPDKEVKRVIALGDWDYDNYENYDNYDGDDDIPFTNWWKS